jgi:ubiquinone/menaquinone biosynthesis C-methylase UbiE
VTASTSYDRIAARYEEARGGVRRGQQLAAALRPWLAPALPTGGVLCDVGTGTGVVAGQLAGPDVRLLAFDISAEMLRQASARLPGRVAVADAAALPVGTGVVDVLLYVWVLHHVGDLQAAMHEARRVLRPGGRAVCVNGAALPREDELGRIQLQMQRALRPGTGSHSAALRQAAAAAGLHVVAQDEAVVDVETSANELADAVEQRLYPYLWDLDEATWAEVVRPAVEAMRRLPDPDRRARYQARHPLRVLQAPGPPGVTGPS